MMPDEDDSVYCANMWDLAIAAWFVFWLVGLAIDLY
jgi:hypothetical protein